MCCSSVVIVDQQDWQPTNNQFGLVVVVSGTSCHAFRMDPCPTGHLVMDGLDKQPFNQLPSALVWGLSRFHLSVCLFLCMSACIRCLSHEGHMRVMPVAAVVTFNMREMQEQQLVGSLLTVFLLQCLQPQNFVACFDVAANSMFAGAFFGTAACADKCMCPLAGCQRHKLSMVQTASSRGNS